MTRTMISLTGFRGIFLKEWMRFSSVFLQTIMSPVVSAMLYFFIFTSVLSNRMTLYEGVSYEEFIVPGLIMMSTWQNAFSNPSSSLMISRLNNSIIFVLLPPISAQAFFLAHVAVSVLRGFLVGAMIFLTSLLFVDFDIVAPGWILVFLLLNTFMASSVGIIAGIWADRFDQAAGLQNFIILPMVFLSGVFYSIHALPEFWQKVSYYNPFLYVIDGFRYGFLGHADTHVWASFGIVLALTGLSGAISWHIIRSGYKLRA